MARIPYVDPAQSSERVQRALSNLPPMNIFRMLALADSAFVPYLRFGQAILTEMDLDAVLRELAILLTAKRTQARYEWIQHELIATQAGATEQQIAAIERDELDADELGAQARAVLAFTDQAIAQPRPDDAVFAAVSAVLPPRQIVELLLAVGSYQMLAHAMTALDIDLDEAMGDQVLSGAVEAQHRREARR
jgi:4-carboxymuconolactone decarboxylase